MRYKVLLLGGTGFVGTHLSRHLQTSCEVIAHGKEYDVRDVNKIRRLIDLVKPDAVVNLAAITTIAESFLYPSETYNIIFTGTLNLLTALKQSGFIGKLLFISSSEVYGRPNDEELPVAETTPLRPISPYSVAKTAAEALCYQWSQTENIQIVIARPFNHFGPGQSERFAISDFAKQLIRMQKGLAPALLHVGDIDVTRDFTDVRDVVNAYGLLLAHGRNGEIYNVCSGRESSIRSILMQLIDLSRVNVKIEQDKERVRVSGLRRIIGSYDKLNVHTGWQPTIPIVNTLKDILNYWVMQL